jgi:predicted transcriptional regulator of viral defense system
MFDSDRIVLLSGKSTGRLDVIRIDGVAGPSSDVTSIRRTLVDVVVRPGYAGGITQVLEAYRGAKGRVSGESLLLILKKMNFVYPYHQAIGFLLEKADYPEADIAPFRQIDMDFDFYLIHGMREREYDHRWRLFYPKGL